LFASAGAGSLSARLLQRATGGPATGKQQRVAATAASLSRARNLAWPQPGRTCPAGAGLALAGLGVAKRVGGKRKLLFGPQSTPPERKRLQQQPKERACANCSSTR